MFIKPSEKTYEHESLSKFTTAIRECKLRCVGCFLHVVLRPLFMWQELNACPLISDFLHNLGTCLQSCGRMLTFTASLFFLKRLGCRILFSFRKSFRALLCLKFFSWIFVKRFRHASYAIKRMPKRFVS